MHQGVPLCPAAAPVTTAQTAQAAAFSVTRGIDPQLTRGTRGEPRCGGRFECRAARGHEESSASDAESHECSSFRRFHLLYDNSFEGFPASWVRQSGNTFLQRAGRAPRLGAHVFHQHIGDEIITELVHPPDDLPKRQ